MHRIALEGWRQSLDAVIATGVLWELLPIRPSTVELGQMTDSGTTTASKRLKAWHEKTWDERYAWTRLICVAVKHGEKT